MRVIFNRALLPREFGEDLIGLFEGFFAADIEPSSGNAPSLNGSSRIEPLNESAWLIGIISFFEILGDALDGGRGIEVEGDPDQGTGWVLGLFDELRNGASLVKVDDPIFLGLLERLDIVDAENRLIFSEAESAKVFETLAKEVVSCDDNEVTLIDATALDDVGHISDCP